VPLERPLVDNAAAATLRAFDEGDIERLDDDYAREAPILARDHGPGRGAGEGANL